MIRVRVYDFKNKLVSMLDSDQPEISVGRSIAADVVIPDFKLDRFEMTIRKDADQKVSVTHGTKTVNFSGKHSFRLKSHTVMITDLNYFSENDGATQTIDTEGRELAVLAAVTVALLLYFDLLADADPTVIQTGKSLFFVALIVSLGSATFSLLSKVINGEYQFFKISTYFLAVVLTVIIFAYQGLGLRWLLPEIFYYDLVWGFLAFVVSGYFFKKLIFQSFESFSKTSKSAIVVVPVLLMLGSVLLLYFPLQSKYKHPSISLRPPLFESFEFSTIEQPEAMAEFEKFLK